MMAKRIYSIRTAADTKIMTQILRRLFVVSLDPCSFHMLPTCTALTAAFPAVCTFTSNSSSPQIIHVLTPLTGRGDRKDVPFLFSRNRSPGNSIAKSLEKPRTLSTLTSDNWPAGAGPAGFPMLIYLCKDRLRKF